MSKPVVLRQQAVADVEGVVDYYAREASEAVALGFVDVLERAYALLASNPAAGTDRFAYELDLPELQAWPLRQYPYVICYVERPAHVDVWRVLHAKRDIPAWMAPSL